ncbi:hypothetical protein MSP8887_01918 [Marinomonas spartinae]|uniref:Uncharacterized protein n=1 Tax=Marinomonas spartinae TaxID=1792290 RepID=A0A1A8TDH6_9GAMM|nr:hypothetical protein [Marinomonas spartinae]SBS30881.1 hypothetical protein MSP8886_01958 [Marinomonas spartinae]SBS33306.1 hypothetical protein MSP8887_01918 [Marinomonas spartinae]
MKIKTLFLLFSVVYLVGCQENIKQTTQNSPISESNKAVSPSNKKGQPKTHQYSKTKLSPYKTVTARLIWKGERALAENRLLTPVDDNANLYFQTALGRDPGNYKATMGIKKIVDTYIDWAWRAAIQGRYKQATTYLNSAGSVNPEDPVINEMKDRIDGLKKRRQQVVSQRVEPARTPTDSQHKVTNTSEKMVKKVQKAKNGQYFLPKNLFSLSDDEILAKIQPIIDKVAKDKSEIVIYWPNDKQARLLYQIINSRISEFRVHAMIYHRSDYLIELQKD